MSRAWTLMLLLLLGVVPGRAQFWGLPAWADSVAKETAGAAPPAGADAWILLDHTVLSYRGAGELRKTRTRVVRVLTKQGQDEGVFWSRGFGKTVSKIRKLKGWNLRPDGSIRKIDRDDLVSIDADAFADRTISADVLYLATLPGVEVGSIVAFESVETIRFPLGPVDLVIPMERNPILRYVLELEIDLPFLSSSKENLVTIHADSRNLQTWAAKVNQNERRIEVEELAAWPKDEPWAAAGLENLPFISLRFEDPLVTGQPDLSDWDAYGKWVYGAYAPMIEKIQPVPLEGLGAQAALARLSQWMRTALTYRVVYLSPARGWVPERSSETIRRRYGDCKDLATCLLGAVRAIRLEGYPVLSRLERGRIPLDAPVNPYLFNHAIAAIRLEQSLGFPAEVQTPRGRFLLVDATARTTPLGWLPAGHRGARLLICSPEGGTWVEVPEAALEKEEVEYRLEGRISREGVLTGTLRILERADAVGLQGAAQNKGTKGLRKQTLAFTPKTPPTRWEVVAMQPPVRPEDPFEATLQIECAGVRVQKGAEWELDLPALLKAPSPYKRSLVKRRFPIDIPPGAKYRWTAQLTLEPEAAPVRSDSHLSTPLREATWQATISGGVLSLTLEHRRNSARWSVQEQETGMNTLRKDRADYLLFLEEALAFQPGKVVTSGQK